MDQELVVERLLTALGALAGASAVVLAAIWLVGRVGARRAWPSGLIVLAQLLTPAAAFYAASVAFDLTGAVADAVVAQKDERISYTSQIPGGWHRSYWATVRIEVADGSTPSLLWLDETTFDRLRPGRRLAVRYLPSFPHLARPADQSTAAWVPSAWVAWAMAAIALAAVAWRALAPRPGVRAVLALATAFVGVVAWVFPTPWNAALAAPVIRGTAEVRQIRDVTRAFVSGRRTGHVDAPQPWQLVELQWVPDGRDQPVTAIDGVDADSVDGLAVGATVPIAYSARRPRDVRLDGARTYRWREWLELGYELLWLVGAVAAVAIVSRVAKTLWWYVTVAR